MILLDYSQIALSNIIVQKLNDENMIRHMILNSIRMYNKKYRNEYGQMVICADGMNTWRKDYFPLYKAHRKKNRAESDQDWPEIFRILNLVREEIKENLPYKVIHLEGCEADDVIGALAMETQEFGKHEPVMIISSDKDFIQLHKYNNVKQYSPIQKKMVFDPNPRTYCFEHICNPKTPKPHGQIYWVFILAEIYYFKKCFKDTQSLLQVLLWLKLTFRLPTSVVKSLQQSSSCMESLSPR